MPRKTFSPPTAAGLTKPTKPSVPMGGKPVNFSALPQIDLSAEFAKPGVAQRSATFGKMAPTPGADINPRVKPTPLNTAKPAVDFLPKNPLQQPAGNLGTRAIQADYINQLARANPPNFPANAPRGTMARVNLGARGLGLMGRAVGGAAGLMAGEMMAPTATAPAQLTQPNPQPSARAASYPSSLFGLSPARTFGQFGAGFDPSPRVVGSTPPVPGFDQPSAVPGRDGAVAGDPNRIKNLAQAIMKRFRARR